MSGKSFDGGTAAARFTLNIPSVPTVARPASDEAQARLAAIVESTDDAIISKTLEGLILSWNPAAERLFGWTAEEAIGRPITIIIPPERIDEEHEILTRLRRGERIDHYETVRVRKNGERLAISLTSSPVRDATGAVVGASKVARDITAQREAQDKLVSIKNQLEAQLADLRRLHEMSSRLSTTLELQPILDETLRTAAAFEGTTRGIITLARGERGECGEPTEIEIGASLSFTPELLEDVMRAPTGAGARGACFATRQRVIVEDTETDPVFEAFRDFARRAGFRAVHHTPLLTRTGTVLGVLSTHFLQPHRPTVREMELVDLCARHAVDFIENAQLYGQLREADRRKDEFLATLAHELRNPLAPIRNALELLRLQSGDPEVLRRTRGIMERQLDQMVHLVNDLMDASRITQGKLQLRRERIPISAAIDSAVEALRPTIDAAGHTLIVEVPEKPLWVDADLTRLGQVFSNLLHNAAKYSEAGGRITISAAHENGEVAVHVRDTGVGIPPEMLPRVFEMFTQVDKTLERSQGGLGIGLNLVRGLVQLHGGTVEAHSAGLGRGSEFIVRLPLAVVPAATEPPDTRANGSGPVGGRRILVVDDNEDSASSLALMLEFMGNDVRTASDGLAALEEAARFQPDVMFLDIGMPRLNGYDAARSIRNRPWGRDVLLVAMTGWGQDEDRRRSAEAGFDLHIVKPLDPAMLSEIVGRKSAPQ